MNGYFSDKKYGFFVTLCLTLLAIVTAIVYATTYGDTRYMAWPAFFILLIGAAVAIALIVFKQYRFAPSVLLCAVFVALLLFIYHIYFFISSVLVGIQYSAFPPEFIANVVLLAVSLVISVVNIFLPQAEEK